MSNKTKAVTNTSITQTTQTAEISRKQSGNADLSYDLYDSVEKNKVGLKRTMLQIGYTIKFELNRNLKKFFSTLFVALAMFILSYVMNEIQESQGVAIPEHMVDYITGYLGFIDLLIIIIATTFMGSIIAEDFEKDTGNLLFPKIRRSRLLVGRIFARYVLASAVIIVFYTIIGYLAMTKYDESIPFVTFESMGFALLYLFAVMSFITFLSSLFNRTATTVVSGILLLLIIFNMIESILMVTGITSEPVFILTYYGKIITNWFNMPEERFTIIDRLPGGPNGEFVDVNFYNWITPNAQTALTGMIIYSCILMISAYFFYRNKQKK